MALALFLLGLLGLFALAAWLRGSHRAIILLPIDCSVIPEIEYEDTPASGPKNRDGGVR